MYTIYPEVRHWFCVSWCAQTTATAASDYNTSSSSIIDSRRWSRILAPQRVNPILLRWAGRVTSLQKFTHQQQCYRSTNLYGQCNSIAILILTTKWTFNFRIEWDEGVAPCSDFYYPVGAHMNTKIIRTFSARGVSSTCGAQNEL